MQRKVCLASQGSLSVITRARLSAVKSDAAPLNEKGRGSSRAKAGLPEVRVHDLKHTFGRRLRAAGVSFEDRQDLLGHRSERITTHYSAAELGNLIEAANGVCAEGSRKSPALVMLKRTTASA